MEYKKTFEDLIEIVVKEGGSDLHLSEGRYPTIRVSDSLVPLVKKKFLAKNL